MIKPEFIELHWRLLPKGVQLKGLACVYFIVFIFKCGSIWTFMNTLEAVFNCAKGCDRFDVSMTVKFGRNVRVIWDDPVIIHLDRPNIRYNDRE